MTALQQTLESPQDAAGQSLAALPCSLILGDCLEAMKNLPDKSVDAIITDLPYGTTACKWDAVIPFVPMWEQVRRVLKPNGVFVTTASQPFTTALIASSLEWFKYEWIWEKNQPSGIATARFQPMKNHENILVFCGGRATYNRQPTKSKITDRTLGKSNGKFWDKTNVGVTGMRPIKASNPDNILLESVNPRTVLPFNIPPNSKGKLHPTQKPVELMQYLVRTYTTPGDVVLDPCMGSGTTCLAAKLEGRRYIGIEREPKYFETAKTRIEGDADLFSANTYVEHRPACVPADGSK